MKVTTTITVDGELLESTDKRAKCCGMSRSAYVELVLLRHVGGEVKLRKEIRGLCRRLATLAFGVRGEKAKR